LCRLPEPEGDAEDGVEPAPDPRLDPMPSRTHRLGETFDGLLVRFALSCLIVQYEQKLGRLRDDVATNTAGGTSIRSAVEVVDRVRQTVSTLSFDASLVAHDLIAVSGDASRWTWEVIEPLPLAAYRQSDDGESASLVSFYAKSVAHRATWVLDLEQRVREQLVLLGSLDATSANLRLQKVVLWVSLVALAVAGVTLFAGIVHLTG
jgi:hypothetical protein